MSLRDYQLMLLGGFFTATFYTFFLGQYCLGTAAIILSLILILIMD